MDEAVLLLMERAIGRAAELLDRLKDESLDNAEHTANVAGVLYTLKVRVVPKDENGKSRPNDVPADLPRTARRSVALVYDTAWRLLRHRGLETVSIDDVLA